MSAIKGVRVFWTYSATATQTAGGGGNIVVHFAPPANTALRILSGKVYTTNGAGRITEVRGLDEDTVEIEVLVSLSSGNAQSTHFPSVGGTAATAENITQSNGEIIIPGDGSSIEFSMMAAANTETLSFNLRAELLGTMTAPTVSVTRSTGTVAAPTVTQDETTWVPVFA